jgi:hypothetical protein
MANFGKIKKVGIPALVKYDICKCRGDAEHPELAGHNKIILFYTKNDTVVYGSMKQWDNYKLAQEYIEKRMQDRLKGCKDVMRRGNIVGAGSLVCHVPEDVRAGDEQKFLDGFRDFCILKFGMKNMLAIAEHHHEHRVHAQAYFLPIVHDKKTGQEKLSAKEYFRRELYQTLHDELNEYMDRCLGYHVSIIRDADDPKKRKNTRSVNTLKINTLTKKIRKLEAELKKERESINAKIEKEQKKFDKKIAWLMSELSEAEGILNEIYEEMPSARQRFRGSKNKPTNDDIEKRYRASNTTYEIDYASQNKERQQLKGR